MRLMQAVMPLAVLCAALSCSASAPVWAQGATTPQAGAQQAAGGDEDTIAPDRPGFTNGSDTVQPGHTLIEAGITRTRDKSANGGDVTTDFPEALVRLGATRRMEIQVALPNYNIVRNGDRGFSNGYIGLKLKFYESKNGNTKASFAPGLSIPFGSHNFRSPRVDPSATLGIQQAVGSRLVLAANLGLSDPSETGGPGNPNGGRNFTITPAAAASYALTSKLGVYIDAYSILPRHGASASVVDGGVTYLLKKNVQLDAEVGTGIGGGDAPSNFIGGGIAVGF